ncbi:MAG: hypothetical protein M3163_00935 [Actinomycetota bacterium]|nr:hypothetical protein [Actinomycetota bacterium]
MLLRTEPVTVGEDLLLFRAVDEPARRAMAEQLLDSGMGGRGWRQPRDVDLWVFTTRPSGPTRNGGCGRDSTPRDGRRVRLVAAAVAASHRGRGIGGRMIEDL